MASRRTTSRIGRTVRSALAGSAALLLLSSFPAWAQDPIPIGPEFQLDDAGLGYIDDQRVAMDARGNFVVVSEGEGFVIGQRFDSDGNPLGAAFPISSGGGRDPSVAMDARGNFVVVWGAGDIFAKRFDAAGNPLGAAFPVNLPNLVGQEYPRIAVDASGRFVVVWHRPRGSLIEKDVFGQRFDSDGNPQGGEFPVNTYTVGPQTRPDVGADNSGNFVVVWESDGQDGASWGVFGQRFDDSGDPAGSEFPVNTNTAGRQWHPSVAMDGSGNFLVAWDASYRDAHGNYAINDIVGRRFDSAGEPQGAQFPISGSTVGNHKFPEAAADGLGNFVVVWDSRGSEHDPAYGDYRVTGQRLDSAGNRVGNEFQANTRPGWDPGTIPVVAADESGDFVVVWNREYYAFGQRFLPEPGGAALVAGVIGLLGLRRWRRRQR